MYSPVPVLSDVLYYTPTDTYNYLTDNRPLYQIQSNVEAVASSLTGIGYGEHASVSGSALSPGSGVELLASGLIKYPDSSTGTSPDSPAILGLVIGSTGAGLSKVIWNSGLLDLDSLGLSGILPSGTTPGQYLVVSPSSSANNIVLSATYSSSSLVLGTVVRNNYITIGGQNTSQAISVDPTPEVNALNNYAVTRKRNFALLQAAGATPIQFTKNTVYQSSITSQMNPLKIAYNPATSQVLVDSTNDATGSGIVYDTTLSPNWVIIESYSQFLNNDGTDSVIYANGTALTTSSWSALSYPSTFTLGSNSGLENYELQQINGGLDFTSSSNLSIFKGFQINKFYQYARVTSLTNPLYGKVTATVTVYDAKYNGNTNLGGETVRNIICDFFVYDSLGRQITQYRAILSGTAADNLYANTNIFRANITTPSIY